MAAKLVFDMKNEFTQGSKNKSTGTYNKFGICTCASLWWCKKTLQLRRGLKTYNELGLTDHTMNTQMAVLRTKDNDPKGQTELVGLEVVGQDTQIASLDDIPRLVRATAPHIAIFWTDTHTMGYRYTHNEKEFFDNENGLYRATETKDIIATMAKFGYGTTKPVEGLRIVKLPA